MPSALTRRSSSFRQRGCGLFSAGIGASLLLIAVVNASPINLEPIRRDGYGMVSLKRPKPNVLTAVATIDGRKKLLLVDSGWGSPGISLHADSKVAAGESTAMRDAFGRSASGVKMSLLEKSMAKRVAIGNCELAQVPLFLADFHLAGGASGVVGGGFLQTCSAIVDLHNLRLYLRPPGKGHRVMLAPALAAAGLSQAPLIVHGYSVFVQVEINGQRGQMALDTGAEFTFLDSALASKLRIPSYKSRLSSTDAAGVRAATTWGGARTFKIGGVKVQAPDIRFGKFPYYQESGGKLLGLLGMDILGVNGAIIDFGARKMYFYPAP